MVTVKKRSITLTYNADENDDGTGAQIQRILGIYSVSRKYGFNYLHTPVKNLLIFPLDSSQDPHEAEKYLKRMNDYFKLLRELLEYMQSFKLKNMSNKFSNINVEYYENYLTKHLEIVNELKINKSDHFKILFTPDDLVNPVHTVNKSPLFGGKYRTNKNKRIRINKKRRKSKKVKK